MKIIKTLEELIEEEVHDTKKYAKLAVEYKDENPALAQQNRNKASNRRQAFAFRRRHRKRFAFGFALCKP